MRTHPWADLLGVRGYDERMRRYGYDDTDLYSRLSAARNLSGGCLSFSHMRHMTDQHASRGLTHVHHVLHRRATSGGLLPRWHEAALHSPTQWQPAPLLNAAASHARATSAGRPGEDDHPCELVSVRRAPFFDELLRDTDELAYAHQEALQLYSRRAIRPGAVADVYSLPDLTALGRVYDRLLNQQERYLAVRPVGGLASRMRSFCSARALAHQTGRKLLVVWEVKVVSPVRLSDLIVRPPTEEEGSRAAADATDALKVLATTAATAKGTTPAGPLAAAAEEGEAPAGAAGTAAAAAAAAAAAEAAEAAAAEVATMAAAPLELISTYRPALFPLEHWRRLDQTGSSARARRRNAVSDDDSGKGVLVSSAYVLEADPPVGEPLYAACLRGLQPAAEVRALLAEPQQQQPQQQQVEERGITSAHANSSSSGDGGVGNSSSGSDDSGGSSGSSHPVIPLLRATPLRVGVHIRMRIEAADTEEVRQYREACHYRHFLPAMRAMRRAEPNARFYLAADHAEAYREVAGAFEPGVVRWLTASARPGCAGIGNATSSLAAAAATDAATADATDGERKGLACQRAAFADLLTLASSDRLILSQWSAWAEVVRGMAPAGTPHYSGCKSVQGQGQGGVLGGASADGMRGGVSGGAKRSRQQPVKTGRSDAGGTSSDSGGGGGRRSKDDLHDASKDAAAYSTRRAAKEGSEAADLLKLHGREVPGMTMRRVSGLNNLPDRPNDIKVRVHKTKSLTQLLPLQLRKLRLIFLMPRKLKVKSLATRVQQMLQLDKTPLLRVRQEESERGEGGPKALPGEPLDTALTIGAYFETHGDATDGFLHITVEIQ